MRGAALLDPAARRIVGYAARPDGRPARVEIALNGQVMLSLLAVGPPTALSAAAIAEIGPPPAAHCAFAALLPAGDHGENGGELTVTANGATFFSRRFDGPAALARYREGWVMTDSVSLDDIRLRRGAFTGRLSIADGAPPPEVALRLRGEIIAAAKTRAEGGAHRLTARLPAEAVGDGVEVVEFVADGAVLARYPISGGEVLEGDLTAEVASLRAELDHLKSAFRGLMAGGVLHRDERPMIVAETLTHVDALLDRRDRAKAAETVEIDEDAEEWELSE